jgi:hypothetical protein
MQQLSSCDDERCEGISSIHAHVQAVLPPYSGVKGAAGGRYRGDSASGATQVRHAMTALPRSMCHAAV